MRALAAVVCSIVLVGCGSDGERRTPAAATAVATVAATTAAPTVPPVEPEPPASTARADGPPLGTRLSPRCVGEVREAVWTLDYQAVALRCLPDADDWHAAVAPIEAALSLPASALAGPPAVDVWCPLPRDWRDSLAAAGYTAETPAAGFAVGGRRVIQLSPGTCLALERVVRDRDLACLDTVSAACDAVALEAMDALVTVAHEAAHLAGEEDEDAARCRALEDVARLAAKVGLPAAQAADVARLMREAPRAEPVACPRA